MSKTILIILFLFLAIGTLRADDYYYGDIAAYSGQQAVQTQNDANSLQCAVISQSLPAMNYVQTTNQPYQTSLPKIDYQRMNLNAMGLQEKLENYSLQLMQKNDQNQAEYLEKNTAPAYTGLAPQSLECYPAYNPSSGEEVK